MQYNILRLDSCFCLIYTKQAETAGAGPQQMIKSMD